MLGISAIGMAYARGAGIKAESSITQVNRLLSNRGLLLPTRFAAWVPFVLGTRPELVVALDWTEFDDDDHRTLCAYAVSRHGRATPLLWKTVKKSKLKNRQKARECALVDPLHALVPPTVLVTLLADHGFGDQNLYALLQRLGWDFVIRFRGGIQVEAEGERRLASAWVPVSGRARKLADAKVTADQAAVPTVVVVHDKKRKGKSRGAWPRR